MELPKIKMPKCKEEKKTAKIIKNIVMKNFLLMEDNTIIPHAPAQKPRVIASPVSLKSMCQAYGLTNLVINNYNKQIKNAIVIAYSYPNFKNDLIAFCNKYGFSKDYINNVTIIQPFGVPQYNEGWAMECALDVQTQYSVFATLKIQNKIDVIQAKSSSFVDMYNAVDYANKNGYATVSMSWGSNEFVGINNYAKYFNNMNTCYFASSGDTNSVSSPSSFQSVCSVGGTTLFLNPFSEQTWYYAGSGVSKYINKPTYQNINEPDLKNTKRCIPDIAANANSQSGAKIIFNEVEYAVGGTSLSCPFYAAYFCAVQSVRSYNKLPLLTTVSGNKNNLQQRLYNMLLTTKYNTFFNDITIGQDGIYTANKNYDKATGCGSLKMDKIFNELLKI
jgi:subtilase family serine protease